MFYAVRCLHPTRVPSQRQLPTDHDCAVSTRGYQSDQPSHLPLVLSPAQLRSVVQSFTTRLHVKLDKVAPYQNRNRNPICMVRFPFRVMILLKSLFRKFRFGFPKFGWFNTL